MLLKVPPQGKGKRLPACIELTTRFVLFEAAPLDGVASVGFVKGMLQCGPCDFYLENFGEQKHFLVLTLFP